MKNSFLSVVVATFILTGCGGDGTTKVAEGDGGNIEVVAPRGYENKVINNQGEVVKSSLGKLSIQIYSNVQDVVDAQI